MNRSQKARMTKIENHLTPKQIVALWLEEAKADGDFFDAIARSVKRNEFPRQVISERVQRAIKEEMKGERDREAIARTIRQAQKDADFLFGLVRRANQTILEESRANLLQAGLLAEQVRHMLEGDAISNELRRLREFVQNDNPYPTDRETADAIEAACHHWVWQAGDKMADYHHLAWTCDHFREQGRKVIPQAAKQWRDRSLSEKEGDRRLDASTLDEKPSEKEMVRLFGTAKAFAAYINGEDYSCGFADVTDEEFKTVSHGLRDKLARLRKTDKTLKHEGAYVWLHPTMIPIMDRAPLVAGEWIDRFAVELAEWASLVVAEGFSFKLPDDTNLVAWFDAYDEETGKEPAFRDLLAIREKARKNLARFKGRTKQIQGRTYLHFPAYKKWKGRKYKGELKPRPGVPAPTWNQWVDMHGGEGKATVAGVKVRKIRQVDDLGFVAYRDFETAYQKQLARADAMYAMQEWMVDKVDFEGDAFVRIRHYERLFGNVLPLDKISFKTRIAEWRARAMAFAVEVYAAKAGVEAIERKYFDSRPILFRDAQQCLEDQLETLKDTVRLFNEMVGFRLERYHGRELLTDEKPLENDDRWTPFRSGFAIDLEEVERHAFDRIAGQVQRMVDFARADVMWDFGEEGKAANLMIEYIGGKPHNGKAD